MQGNAVLVHVLREAHGSAVLAHALKWMQGSSAGVVGACGGVRAEVG